MGMDGKKQSACAQGQDQKGGDGAKDTEFERHDAPVL
jgi:hypothetical protein